MIQRRSVSPRRLASLPLLLTLVPVAVFAANPSSPANSFPASVGVETPGGRRLDRAIDAVEPGRLSGLLAVVAFRRPPTADELARLAGSGVGIIGSLGGDAFIVERGNAATPPLLSADWFAYTPADALSRELTPAALAARADAEPIPVMVHLSPQLGERAVVDALVSRGLPLVGSGPADPGGRIVTLLPPSEAAAAAARLAAIPGVVFVERVHRIGLLNDRSVGTVQSGTQGSAPAQTPIWQQGIRGEGQVVGEIDTGLDVDNCWFRDTAVGLPATNTWSAGGGYATATNPAHRKVLAVNFLYSCDQFPAGSGCDAPADPADWDNQGHGTHVGGNMTADNDATIVGHDAADGIAPAAKIVAQDGGFNGGDACADLPGLGCPLVDLTPVFAQAAAQGVRIHNNSYGDNENAPAPGQSNYTSRAADIDRFVWNNREFLFVHAAGNSGGGNTDFSVGSPGTNKNGLCVGSTRTGSTSTSDENMSSFSSRGWTGDGRIKPDIMAPGYNVSSGNNGSVAQTNCGTDSGGGTSYAAPTLAGTAALARQYFTDGFYPSYVRTADDGFAPSAALLRALLVNSAVSMTGLDNNSGAISPIPSNEQGWGRVRLDRALPFGASPSRRLYVDDHRRGLAAGDTTPISWTFTGVDPAEPLKVTLAWTDYPGTPDSPPVAPTIGNSASWSAARLVNDLDLTVTSPSSAVLRGNVFSSGVSTSGGSADRRNNLEQVLVASPAAGSWTVTVTPFSIVQGDQELALVVTGRWTGVTDCNPGVPSALAVTGSTESSVSLAWSAGSPAGATYRVWRTSASCLDGPWTLLGTTASTVFTDATVPPATTVRYRVSALSVDGRCESRRSGCVTGICTLAPTFGGLSAAAVDALATCGVQLSWGAASASCPGGDVVYNVYRDTDPSFVPSPSKRVAACLDATAFHDTSLLLGGVNYRWIVRAEDRNVAGSGPCGGSEDGNLVRRSATPSGVPTTIFADGFESGLGNWTATNWSLDGTVAHTGANSAHSANASSLCMTLATTSAISLAGTTNPRLRWSANWNIESLWDGAVVEVAPGPAYSSWTILTPTPAYPGSTNTSTPACIGTSRACWTGASGGWVDGTASLAPWVGQSIKVRFRYGTDTSQNDGGIWVDDVAIEEPGSCTTNVDEVSPDEGLVPLRLSKGAGKNELGARFERKVGAAAYNLYEGVVGSWYSHGGAAGNACGVAGVDAGDGSTTASTTASAGDRYYLVTAVAGGMEGPSGFDSDGAAIPSAQSSCAP